MKAGELVGKLYDAILKQYKDPENAETLKSLNILCVRLVFLLYAEDAGIFPEKDMFGRYMAKFHPDEARKNLMELFTVLNTKPENRDPYLNDDLAAFPYVNGGLFAEREIEIPRFNAEIVDILVNKASAGFDWSEISPTIFGAVFESTLNPETRRKGGMHYTSIKNIHRVIDPLFLDDLKNEFYEICGVSTTLSNRRLRSLSKVEVSGISAKQRSRLEQLRNKIADLKFLDPACGSGNFLTETYISLRRLENEILKNIYRTQY
ncbi:methylase, partial [bacterium]|nr:methylase [bacterium]